MLNGISVFLKKLVKSQFNLKLLDLIGRNAISKKQSKFEVILNQILFKFRIIGPPKLTVQLFSSELIF